jgi:hypothetical protein
MQEMLKVDGFLNKSIHDVNILTNKRNLCVC